ncbi:long-chain-fatty-acid--CoA ligase 1-like isoform X2 [Argiope bruennichi]|uniref:long-chain-fatty-acid--CoA ligase 1-like isoform X2 n=1 Tax=Argiope bruennichi TaxID=94029 RepID=UPI002493E2CF|nr:long-chain-fatty-acid--CoA ligase 1-like isoform X2 [Argiope bruennichi]XP_055941490.1 long-chain-fatty-acid--CoA ligase 1-like isoform X2 [Argiope bruennichi]
MDFIFRVAERKDYIGSGLLDLGVPHSHEAMIGICTKTRPEFVLVMLACSRYSFILVPLYHCFGTENMAYIADQVKMEVMFCETPEFAASILKNKELYPHLKQLILFDGSEDEIAALNSSDLKVMSLKDLEIRGKLNLQKPKKPDPDDLFCICYTSGTTGTPKGVMVTHRNLLSCIASLDAVLGESVPKNESLMCYLPCAHIYEIINEVFCLFHGCRLGFFSGSTDTLLSDIAELKPAVLPLVPKLMNLIYARVKKRIGLNSFRRYLLHLSLQQKEKSLQKGIVSKTAIWDKLLFSKIQKLLGGSIQMIFTASAPVSKEVMQFFRCSMGCLVFEVYGLSELGAAAMTLLSEHDSGFVGPPLPCNHIKLVSTPEMSYFAENDEGEICVKGANVFSGYFKNPEATAEALDADGWFHTGDIGKWLPNGTLKITDRKKHIFKLAQGEYIVPDVTESAYMESHIVSQVYIDGNSDQEFIVGVVVPEKQVFLNWAKSKGFQGDFETLCQNKEVKSAVLDHLWTTGKKRNLSSLQQIGNVFLSAEAFSQENGLLTPTLKLKRSSARKKYEQIFLTLYEEGNLRPSK